MNSPYYIDRLPMSFPGEGEQLLLVAISNTAGGAVLGSVRMTYRKHEPMGYVQTPGIGKTEVADAEHRVMTCQFVSLFVVPGHRRLGIGRALVEKVIEESRKLKSESLSCYVKPNNLPAHQFYEKLGFYRAMIFDDGDFCYSRPLAPLTS